MLRGPLGVAGGGAKKIAVFLRVITPRRLVGGYRRFGKQHRDKMELLRILILRFLNVIFY
jgi:hypothetical protein